jgi:hypothetical protein
MLNTIKLLENELAKIIEDQAYLQVGIMSKRDQAEFDRLGEKYDAVVKELNEITRDIERGK